MSEFPSAYSEGGLQRSAPQRCARCRKEEKIPTHQYVKFCGEVHYLCSGCWEAFRLWRYALARGQSGRED